MHFQLEDLIATYPDAHTPGIQTVVTSKREFAELASRIDEPTPLRRGDPFKHQKLVGRLMRWLDSLLLMHATGTGKTCSVAACTEYYRKLRDKGGHIRRAYILVKGPTLKAEFKRQILCVCTAGDYETEIVRNAETEQSRKSNITREIKKWYSIKTYIKFANKLAEPIYEEYKNNKGKTRKRIVGHRDKMTDAEIMRRYSNCIFFVDEVHNLHVKPDVTRGAAVIPETDDPEKDAESRTTTRFTYDQIWRLFHNIERSKIILASATPMVNEVSEIGSIMNLILPSNQQIPDNFDYDAATLQMVEPYFRNRISYVRARDSGAVPEDVGVPLDVEYNFGDKIIRASTKVYESQMLRYLSAETGAEMGQDVGYQEAASTSADFYIVTRHAADFVFPDNSYGSTGFHRYIVERKELEKMEATALSEGRSNERLDYYRTFIPMKTEDGYLVSPLLYEFLTNLEFLRYLSAKFTAIAIECSTKPGNCYVYSDFVQLGADLLGLIFEGIGFEKFTGSSPVFEKKGGLPPVCPPPSKESGARTTKIPLSDGTKVPFRYALLTSETTQAQADNIKATFNSYENRHGQLIKVVIGSLITREGISLSNVLQIHLASAGWNPSSIYQATSRAIRATSHDALIEEEKNRLAEEAYAKMSQAEIEQWQAEGIDVMDRLRRQAEPKIIVQVYKHVAVSSQSHRVPDGTTNSIDRYMYERSERKEIEIKRMERMMKQCAIDCQINYRRNVRDTDVDFSPTCDYDVCRFKCVDPAPESHDPDTYALINAEFLDNETYDVFYSDEIVEKAIENIIELFHYYFSLPINLLYEADIMKDIDAKFIDLALTKIIREKRPIRDRFGFTSYLREDGDVLFLQRDYPVQSTGNKYSVSTYTANLIALEPSDLAGQLVNLQVDEQAKLRDELRAANPDSERFNDLLDQFNIQNKVRILEEAMSCYLGLPQCPRKEDGTPMYTADHPYILGILNRFRNVYYSLHEPAAEIQALIQANVNRGTTRGRRRKDESKIDPNTIPPLQPEEVNANEPMVYIHNLYSQVSGNVSYNTIARFNKAVGRIRILKPTEGTGWRDTNTYETPIYTEILRRELARRIAPYEAHNIYGTILHDKKFRIRNKLNEDPNQVTEDGRLIARGKECRNWHRRDLYDILWQLGVPAPEGAAHDITDKEQLIKYLLNQNIRANRDELDKLDLAQLQYYYQWARSGATRAPICDRIQNFLAEKGLLFVE